MNNVSEDEYSKLNENLKHKLKPIDFDNLVQNPENMSGKCAKI